MKQVLELWIIRLKKPTQVDKREEFRFRPEMPASYPLAFFIPE
jgi:hypothetical protein